MPLPKAGYNIQLGGGLDTKTDPFQVDMGHMLELENIRFASLVKYVKRNGYGQLTTTPYPTSSSLSTLNDALVAIGPNLEAYSASSQQWANKGSLNPLKLMTQNLMVEQYSFQGSDGVVLPNGIAAVVGSTNIAAASVAIVDTVTGQTILPVTNIFPYTSPTFTCALPRVFAIGNYFLFTYINISGQLVYRSVDHTLSTPTLSAEVVIASGLQMTEGLQFYDGYVGANNRLYLAWNTTASGISVAYINTSLVLSSISTIASVGAQIAVFADNSNVWVAFGDDSIEHTPSTATTTPITVKAAAFDLNLATVLASTTITSQPGICRLSVYSAAGVVTVAFEKTIGYNGASVFISTVYYSTVTTAGTVVGPTQIQRGVSMASKLFLNPNGQINFLAAYGDANKQGTNSSLNPTYFLLSVGGQNLGKLAQSNAQFYPADQNTETYLTQVSVNNGVIQLPYMNAANVTAAGGNTGSTPSELEFISYGISIANISQQQPVKTSEAASALVIPGMLTNFYDGNSLSELGFNVYPEFVGLSVGGAGSMTAQQYQYSVTYEWTDNSGRIYRSAPSLPVSITLSATGSVVISVPTLKLTKKNNVRIMIYRWSVAQQQFFLVNNTVGTAQGPVNNPNVDFVTYTDGLSDGQILGHTLLYTTGGILEDIAPPASAASTVVKNRVWLLDAEDRNLLWYSKVLVEGAAIEFSDLQTVYVSPSTNSQMSGFDIMTTLGQMDDKLIIFADKSIRYLVGNGPDATGANNDYGDPTLISSTVGCSNVNSISLQPNGLMFQSNIGIWLLGRDLNTSYIGAPVEKYNSSTVLAAVTIQEQTQCRFVQASGNILVFDYFVNRWSIDTGIPSIGSTIYQGLHTLLSSSGVVSQETPGQYLDLGAPVLQRYTTPWIKVMNQASGSGPLQNLQRVNHYMILGSYYNPVQLQCSMAYDFHDQIAQTTTITPDTDPVLNWRVFLDRQKCKSMRITIQEVYIGTPGQGFDFSGLDIVGSGKLTFPKIQSSRSIG